MPNLSSILTEKSTRGVVRARLRMEIRDNGKRGRWKDLAKMNLSVKEPGTLWVIWRGIMDHLRD